MSQYRGKLKNIPARQGMTVCPKHNRWTYIAYVDGKVVERECPECPSVAASVPRARNEAET